jgi:NADH:ubiquinone oxidoreductase subunit F (NADH-binding)
MTILDKIKKTNLVGRGGACFPVASKWEAVLNAPGETKFVVCNASEGEPGVKKDGFIIEKYFDRVLDGMEATREFIGAEKIYFYVNPHYYKIFKEKLKKEIGHLPIEIFIKPEGAGYIGGEESSVLNAIEGKRIEPRLRPPFPTTHGLFGCPTLVHNVETFFNISLLNTNEFKNERFYTIGGDALWNGVYLLPDYFTIEKILKETGNYPNFSFFAQVGGDASGEVLSSRQLKRSATGSGLITIHSIYKHKPMEILGFWLDFFMNESCGKCTPCREGVYRLREILISKNPDWRLFGEIINNLSESAFCGLGCAVPIPIVSYFKNVYPELGDKKIDFLGLDKKIICECF